MRGKQFAIARMKWGLAMALCVFLSALPAAAQKAQRVNRIQHALGSGGWVHVRGSVHPLLQGATDLGPVNPQMVLNPVTLNFGMSAAQQAEFQTLLAAQHNPASPLYHQWLTQEQYGERFGMTDDDLAQVRSWLESQGFTVTGVSRSRNAMYFSGRAWQVESAFRTQLHRYQREGVTHFANATQVQMPAELAGVTLTVRGMDNFRPKPQSVARPRPAYTVDTGGPEPTHFLSPADWATIYAVNAIYDEGYTGAGAYVGVVGQTYAPQSDIAKFRSAAGLPPAKLEYVCISAGACNATSAGDLTEADLDIEWAGGIAKDATVTYIYSDGNDHNQNVLDALAYAVQNYTVPATGNPLPVVSMSYDTCEAAVPSSFLNFMSALGAQANSQGQTLVISSGDTGTVCVFDNGYPATMGASASVPPSSPYFTGVGGTTLSGDSPPDDYWNQTLDLVNSALQYIPEEAWNDSEEFNSLSASGGGVSEHFAQPDGSPGTGGFVQPTPSNFSGTPGRFVPDIAFAASAAYNGYMMCTQENNSSAAGTDCSSGFVSSKGYLFPVGGTSAGAPSFAGMLTLLTQRYGPQGNVNVLLYGLAADSGTYASVFHDVTTGDNIVACSGGAGCVGGMMGYEAATGYDLTTGLGSVNGGQLYAAMNLYEMNPSATSISLAPGGSEQIMLNLSSNTYAGTVSFSVSTSSGEISAPAPADVTLSSGGAGNTTLTITASQNASVHPPAMPWDSGTTIAFAALLAGAPFLLRRKGAGKIQYLCMVLLISTGGLLISCGGNGGGTPPPPQARTYLVTVQATASGAIANPAPLTITVQVQ